MRTLTLAALLLAAPAWAQDTPVKIQFLRTEKGRLAFDGALLKLPVLGPVLRKVTVARFTRTMGTLLSIPLLAFGIALIVNALRRPPRTAEPVAAQ